MFADKTIAASERRLAARVPRWQILRPGETVVELKIGELVSHKIDGAEEPVNSNGLGRASLSRSGTCCGYSQNTFFIYGAKRVIVTDLGLITHPRLRDGQLIELVAFVAKPPPLESKTAIVTLRWRIEDASAAEGFVARLDAARAARLAALPAEAQQWMAPRNAIALEDDSLD